VDGISCRIRMSLIFILIDFLSNLVKNYDHSKHFGWKGVKLDSDRSVNFFGGEAFLSMYSKVNIVLDLVL